MNPSRLVLLGDPVAQSLSPKFQSAAIAAAGLNVAYEAVRISAPDLPRAAQELAAERAGGNVTVPHKAAFLPLCAEVTPLAARVGAVNTFWTFEGKLAGDNTDVGGFQEAAKLLLGGTPGPIEVAVIGAGGSAAAVLAAIEHWPRARVRLYSRRADQSAGLAARFGDFVRVESSAHSALHHAKLIVNATPVGMRGDASPFELHDVSPGAAILDLVYRRGGTPLTIAATAAGIAAADGTEMLLEQGALSFARWFGCSPDREVMSAALA